jgi:uncharacterized membrane protein YkoI
MSAICQVASGIVLSILKMTGSLMLLHARTFIFALAFALTLALAPTGAGHASSRDHDAVLGAVERGEIRPLAEILAAVRSKLPGDITGVEIERKGGQWVYEFRVVDKNGRLFDIYVDARSGDIRRIKEK